MDDLIERVARAIHHGLGEGWAYSNYSNNELVHCRDQLAGAARAALAIAFEEAAKICTAEADRLTALWLRGQKTDSHLEGLADGWASGYVEFDKRAKEFEVKP